jgi:4-aminobutyrate aminotransferase
LDLLGNGMIANAAEMGAYMMRCLSAMMDEHPSMGDVRGRGLMVGVEIVEDRAGKRRDPERRLRIVNEAFARGLLLLGAGPNTIRLIPPLNVSRKEIDEALSIFSAALDAVESAQGASNLVSTSP